MTYDQIFINSGIQTKEDNDRAAHYDRFTYSDLRAIVDYMLNKYKEDEERK